ncbi:MAG: aldehyde dehydrogenase [Candidatus Gastranaerophilales bacterium]|nr:aldehyde dehydrogenase [Candidatus Gastranaerophilales bacterium]
MMDNILAKQQALFKSGKTLDIKTRLDYLKKLKLAIKNNEEKIANAIHLDLGKSATEAYMCEIGLALSEITYFQKNLKKFAKDKVVLTPLTNFHSKSIIKSVPWGNVLIISPWNYPFLLAIEPLVDAISAGNTVILKPSAYSPNTSKIVKEIIESVFESEYVAVVTGGRAENQHLLKMKFDYIFFTGSQNVGKEVLRCASENLTPVSLELGGKSPCIVDETANIELSAKRIVFGKFLNCGQTCVAPDYIYCHKDIKDKLIVEIKKQIKLQFGENPLENADYGKIINEKHFNRLIGLIDENKVIVGAKSSNEKLKIEPTVLDNVSFDDKVMQEEIFGPILPIMTYENLDEIIDIIESRPHSLALYIFSSNKENIKKVTTRIRYGGGCVNDVVVHLATPEMPFGGFGASGMGNYHGKFGFDTFSHKKSILDKKTWFDLPMRYQPYNKLYSKLLKLFLN